ncbi:OmpA family protein [Lewinella sp. 4G2]|uniref:OmpA family protein n=1 Tax=Lewinella sp. 4G2 TaxID=1803372 RepID=UPI0007B4DF42|nr:OmpA family protein [Lewinella sp. 4G2]OAV43097.1 hypothetical protein A3850_000665 [Lewinella sp. 4G2]
MRHLLQSVLPAFVLIATLNGFMAAQGTPLGVVGTSEISLENCRAINSPDVDFGPVRYQQSLVYLTRPRRGSLDARTKETYFRLHVARLDSRNLPGRGRRFSTALSDNFNEGPVSFTQDEQVIYFTRTLQRAGGTVESEEGEANLGLFSAYHDGYDWTAIRPLPHNDPNFTNQHPSVTADGRRIFFASNRPGGFGGYDLYFADYRDGAWGKAINLGPEINTGGNEAFPFIHPSGRLFFSSNGHPGMGGQDLFMIDLSNRVWGRLVNLPEPINSPDDDISLSLGVSGTTGYLSSNRPGGSGEDDIYRLTLRQGLISLEGAGAVSTTFSVYDEQSSKRIAGASVWVEELTPAGRLPAGNGSFALEETRDSKTIVQRGRPIGLFAEAPAGETDRNGNFNYAFHPDRKYFVTLAKPGYGASRFAYSNGAATPLTTRDQGLKPQNCINVAGRLVDQLGQGVSGTSITYYAGPGAGSRIAEAKTGPGGYYEVCLPPGEEFVARVAAGALTDTDRTLSTLPTGTAPLPRHELTLAQKLPKTGFTEKFADAILPLPEIEYPYLSANPLPNRSPDLLVLRNFLREYPTLKVILIVHADGPELQAQLQRLTEERAIRLRAYLEREGIDPARVRTVAYGNTQPLVFCGECTEEEFRTNTRIEAKVIDW